MVKITADQLRFFNKNDFRVLTAIEMGMKNHDLVPTVLINALSNLKVVGGTFKSLTNLHKHKCVYHESRPYDGYRLTYAGYDILVLMTMTARGSISGFGSQIGVGKESDVYLVNNADGVEMACKFARLGRTSFRTIKRNRDYLQHRKNASWLYMSRLAAFKEYCYMKVLHENGFPVPTPIDFNRHTVVMSLCNGYPMSQIRELRHPDKVYLDCMNIIVRLANHGLIHGDFNEFNLMISEEEVITMIDFPQMVSTDHLNAQEYFDRDVVCVQTFFKKRFNYESKWRPYLNVDTKREGCTALDKAVSASGFTNQMQKTWEKLWDEENKEEESSSSSEESTESSEDSEPDVVVPQKKPVKKAPKIHQIQKIDEIEDTKLADECDFLEKGRLKLETVPTEGIETQTQPTPEGAPVVGTEPVITETDTKTGDGTEPAVETTGEPQPAETGGKKKKTDEEIKKEIAERRKIQKRVRGQIKKDSRRKVANKNDYKNREKRALHRETEESKHDYF